MYKAKVTRVLDIDDPEKDIWGIMIKMPSGKELPGSENGKPYYTYDHTEAETKVKAFNEGQKLS
jgi:hypothetical protein